MSTLRVIKLSLAGAGSFDTTLADETASPGDVIVDDFKPVNSSTPQVVPVYGQPHKKIYYRGNAQWDVSFTVNQQHEDAESAAEFFPAQAAAIAGLVDLQYVQGDVELYLANAQCTRFEPVEQTGVATTVRYTFVGETYSDVDPSA